MTIGLKKRVIFSGIVKDWFSCTQRPGDHMHHRLAFANDIFRVVVSDKILDCVIVYEIFLFFLFDSDYKIQLSFYHKLNYCRIDSKAYSSKRVVPSQNFSSFVKRLVDCSLCKLSLRAKEDLLITECDKPRYFFLTVKSFEAISKGSKHSVSSGATMRSCRAVYYYCKEGKMQTQTKW